MSFVKIAKEFLQLVAKDLDQYTTEKSKVKVKNFKEVTLFTPSHVQFAKYGRGPGKNPPLDNILKFIGHKGIIFEGMDKRGTAFAIQASISKNGTKNYVPNAPSAVEETVQKYLKEYNEELAKFVVADQNEELQKIYKKNFPETITMRL